MTDRVLTSERAAQDEIAVSASERCMLRARLDELACGDAAILQRCIRLLIDTNRTTLAALREAVRGTAWNQVASEAHQIAGSMRLLDCNGMIELLAQLEAAARAQDGARMQTLFATAERSLDYLDTALEAIA